MAVNTYQGEAILQGILKYYKYPDDMFSGSASLKQEVRDAIEIPRRLASSANAQNTPAVATTSR